MCAAASAPESAAASKPGARRDEKSPAQMNRCACMGADAHAHLYMRTVSFFFFSTYAMPML